MPKLKPRSEATEKWGSQAKPSVLASVQASEALRAALSRAKHSIAAVELAGRFGEELEQLLQVAELDMKLVREQFDKETG